jgi:5-methyltetrahydropteroyltriglutamate--homocysteine methyltransferase
MRRSSERILTTHAGSLPRPENLTDLFVRRARGESIDADAIAAAGVAAVRAIVPRQAEAGVDIGNNGEQQHDSFFLYLKERLTGLGGSWQRPSRADVERYPEFKKRWIQQTSSAARVSPNEGLPMALGGVRYIDAAAIKKECRDFADVLKEYPNVFVRLHECPVAWHRGRGDQEPILRQRLEIPRGARRRSADRV